MISTLVSIIAIGVLIIIHEAGHFFVARWSKMKVNRFSVGFGPTLAKVQRGETEYVIGALPLGGYVQIEGLNPHDGSDPASPSSFQNRPMHLRIATIFAGAAANYVLGFVLFSVFYAYFGSESLAPVRVVKVVAESPAERAGLQPGDLIVGTASTTFDRVDELGTTVQQQGGSRLELVVKRGDEEKRVELVPEARPGGGYRIGVELEGTGRRMRPLGLLEGSKTALVHIGVSTVATVRLVALLVQGKGCDQVAGPVGMVKGMSRRVETSIPDAMAAVAEISIGLGAFNLLPVPALDGSRLLFLILGAIRRKPVSARIETYVHVVGFVLLIGLLIIVSIADFAR